VFQNERTWRCPEDIRTDLHGHLVGDAQLRLPRAATPMAILPGGLECSAPRRTT
jgi:hypothetical protein